MSVLIQDIPQSGKGLARGLEPAPDLVRGVRVIHGPLTMPHTTIERPLGVPRPDTPS